MIFRSTLTVRLSVRLIQFEPIDVKWLKQVYVISNTWRLALSPWAWTCRHMSLIQTSIFMRQSRSWEDYGRSADHFILLLYINGTNDAATSEDCASAKLLLLVARNLGILQWHNVHTNFRINRSTDSKAERWKLNQIQTHTEHSELISYTFSLNKRKLSINEA
jgi:hypothetical protein